MLHNQFKNSFEKFGIDLVDILAEAKLFEINDLGEVNFMRITLTKADKPFESVGLLEHSEEDGEQMVSIGYDEPVFHNMEWSPEPNRMQKVISFPMKHIFRMISEMIEDGELTTKELLEKVKYKK